LEKSAAPHTGVCGSVKLIEWQRYRQNDKCVHSYVHTYIYIYIYIHKERE